MYQEWYSIFASSKFAPFSPQFENSIRTSHIKLPDRGVFRLLSFWCLGLQDVPKAAELCPSDRTAMPNEVLFPCHRSAKHNKHTSSRTLWPANTYFFLPKEHFHIWMQEVQFYICTHCHIWSNCNCQTRPSGSGRSWRFPYKCTSIERNTIVLNNVAFLLTFNLISNRNLYHRVLFQKGWITISYVVGKYNNFLFQTCVLLFRKVFSWDFHFICFENILLWFGCV